ncbi:tetratricopeptide repeat protein [Pseudomonadota bacterium]
MSLFNELKRRNVIRVAIAYLALAWLVTEVAGTLFPAFGIPDWGIRFLVIVFALGFVPALIISWAYEITPEGLKREKEVVRDASITHLTAKRLDVFTIGLIVVAISFILADRFLLSPRISGQSAAPAEVVTDTVQTPGPESQYPPNSIAVLPFVNMSDDPGNEYFSDGISEELLNLLVKIPELRVIARTSSFAYKGKDVNITDISHDLNVDHVLEGSVRKAGNQVRITAQLIRTADSSHLWSETYDRTLDNIFSIQDEIAKAVVEQLKIRLLGDVPELEQTSPEAYALYLQAREVGYQYNRTGLEQSNDLYRQSLAIDPDFAPAWSGLGTNFFWAGYFGRLQYDEAFALALEATNKSLALNPDSASAHALLGGIALLYEGDHREAAKHYQHALKLDPSNSENLSMAALQLERLGRMKETIALREYLVTNDPANSRSHFYLGISYLRGGQPNNAIASFQTVLALEPSYVSAHFRIGVALLFKDEAEAALTEMKLEPTEAYRWFGLTMAYYATGQQEESDATLTRLVEKYEQKSAYNIAYVYAFRDEADKAFEWLEKAILFRDSGLSSVSTQGLFLNIHNDPRWLPFLESIGQSPEQLAAIEFEVNLPE